MKPHSPYRLAFIDLDDTLLGPDKTISPDNLAALTRLRDAGVEIVVASGRHHKNITSINAIGQQGWVLSSHGSVVRHQQTGEILLEMTMNPDLAHELCHRARELGMSVIAYQREGAYIEEHSSWTDLYARQAGWEPQQQDFDHLDRNGFQKVIWSEEPNLIDEIAPAMMKELSDRLYVVETNPELLEFVALSSNKAVGAQALTRKLGIPAEQTLAFGDGNNDVELLKWAGLSVAMSHGRESARKAARFVSPAGPPESAFARAVDLALGV
jgi:Cof subfamily protein (haloacid dehalogenase superfamily)